MDPLESSAGVFSIPLNPDSNYHGHLEIEGALHGCPTFRRNGKLHVQWTGPDEPPSDPEVEDQIARQCGALRWAVDWMYGQPDLRLSFLRFAALAKIVLGAGLRRTDAELARGIGGTVAAVRRERAALRKMLRVK